MTAKDIQENLYKLYHNHIYHLYNSYLYSWECDYYSRSKSGTDYEVEIKLSRGDFFADFKKDKHRLFEACTGKDRFIVSPCGEYRGEVIAWYHTARLQHRRHSHRRYSQQKIADMATHDDFLNGYKHFYLQKENRAVYAMGTRIVISSVDKLVVPNRFYYACPEGLIKPEEIPPYAGLIYCSIGHAWEVKKSPFLHKRRVDLTSALLKKFYWETVEHRNAKRFANINTA